MGKRKASAGLAGQSDGKRWIPFVSHGKPALRRAVPIHAYVGPNGSGKSLAAVYDTLPSLLSGRPVLSTVRLHDVEDLRPCDDLACMSPRHGLPDHYAVHPLWVPFVDFRQLLEVEHCDVLMDEVTGVADAREFAGMPVQVRNFLVQLRRRDVVLRWTSPAWAFGDVTIRRVTQAATVCSAYLPVASDDSLWRDRRAFVWRTYDARDLDEFDSAKRERIRSYIRQLLWRPGSVVESAYDTRDQVLSLGALNDAGLCMDCGGKRSHPRCSCDRQPLPVGPRSRSGLAGASAPKSDHELGLPGRLLAAWQDGETMTAPPVGDAAMGEG